MNDLISRQAVIDLYEKYHPYLATKVYEFGQELRKLPSAKGDWIPIKIKNTTEEEKEYYRKLLGEEMDEIFDCRLPDDGQEVLISTKYDTVRCVTFENDGVCCGFEDYDPEEVIAWMPSPTCYKGEDNANSK